MTHKEIRLGLEPCLVGSLTLPEALFGQELCLARSSTWLRALLGPELYSAWSLLGPKLYLARSSSLHGSSSQPRALHGRELRRCHAAMSDSTSAALVPPWHIATSHNVLTS